MRLSFNGGNKAGTKRKWVGISELIPGLVFRHENDLEYIGGETL